MIQATDLAGMMLVADMAKFSVTHPLYYDAMSAADLWTHISREQDRSGAIIFRAKLNFDLILRFSEDLGLVTVEENKYSLTDEGKAYVESFAASVGHSLVRDPGIAGLKMEALGKISVLRIGPMTAQGVASFITKLMDGDGEVTRAEVLEAFKPAIKAGYIKPEFRKGETLFVLTESGRQLLDDWLKQRQALGLPVG